MKIYIYQRLDNDQNLFEKISSKRKDVYDFAIKDIKSFFGSELGEKPSDPNNDDSEPIPMKVEEWDIEDAIELINYCQIDNKYPQLLLRFSSVNVDENNTISDDKVNEWLNKIPKNQYKYLYDWTNDYNNATVDSMTLHDIIRLILESDDEEFLKVLLE